LDSIRRARKLIPRSSSSRVYFFLEAFFLPFFFALAMLALQLSG